MRHRITLTLLVALGLNVACAASDADCASLGERFVELYNENLSEESRKLDPQVIANAAESGREQVVEQCKREGFSRASIKRCLESTTMAEFRKC